MKDYFAHLVQKILATRQPNEHFFISLYGEQSHFIRINGSKVRQSGTVDDTSLDIALVIGTPTSGLRRASYGVTLSGLMWQDGERIENALKTLRKQVPELPVDPFAELPSGRGTHSKENAGQLLDAGEATETLLSSVESLDLAGIYSSGPCFRGMANSEGQLLWFSADVFTFDYSLFTEKQKAVKGTYSGSKWNQDDYTSQLERDRTFLKLLEKPSIRISKGSYRTYLAPHSVAELATLFNLGAFSEASIRQGDSPLRLVQSGEQHFSPLFNLTEDFSLGQTPQFNELGELSAERIALVENGKLKNTLVSSRSAKEYSTRSNAASVAETLRSPVIGAGKLDETRILEKLDTGLYLSNLHYLNWSDQTGGRITGMTRYACFWVENGKIVAPIEDMRWDDSLFHFFGSTLEGLTHKQHFIADVASYERRALGGILTPGILLSKMEFTL